MPARTGRPWRERIVPAVLRRDGSICHLCGKPGADTADHLIPWSQGGTNELTNLAAAHTYCNRVRSDRDIEGARQELAALNEPDPGWDW